jgi:hypothetical protein
MKKVIRDGMVGVLVSTGHGAGFSTWGYPTEAIFDPTLIQLVENEKLQEAVNYCETTWPGEYSGGVEDLIVRWVPDGSEFVIDEYDGSESLKLKTEFDWITA